MSEAAAAAQRPPAIPTAIVAVGAVAIASVLGNLATMPNIAGWYAGLDKPSFNPPNWVFGPVWTVLYVLMAFAAFRVARADAGWPERRGALVLFAVQLALNAAWSWAFFGFHSPAAGLVVIAGLWLSLAATIVAFWRIDRLAAACLIPYLAWVSFAAVLNGAIWRLN